MADETAAEYSSQNINVLKDAEHIRLRPGMYVGDTAFNGLHHLVFELINNSIDEAMAGYGSKIHVSLNADGSCSVSDDGRGISVAIHPETGISKLELAMTRIGFSAKFDKPAYRTGYGVHGLGAKAVTALSEWCEVRVRRGGRTYVQEYERGKAIYPCQRCRGQQTLWHEGDLQARPANLLLSPVQLHLSM